jgi:aminoglycoside phosphotransferase (APT) family kinase protein
VTFPGSVGILFRMQRPWTPERVITLEAAQQLLAARFPELRGATLEPFAEGWDNTAFLVNGTWVFRFPRREVAVALLESECAVQPALAPQLPWPIPVPRFTGVDDGAPAWPFGGYALLPGTTTDRLDLDDAARARLAAPLGEFLRTLHAVDASTVPGLIEDRMRRSDGARRVELIRERWTTAIDTGLLTDPGEAERILGSADLRRLPRTDAVCHGDLYARHLLLDDALQPAGIIDWGDVHRGDPVVDLMLPWQFLPRVAHAEFRRSYGPISTGDWSHARLLALAHAIGAGLYAIEVDDVPFTREVRGSMRRLLEPNA